jgi:NADH:ubiquinone oxidoreductase subunit 5 (subunit L)/multisubunit Na+/H+ antiporter MnhA subunit
MVQNDLKKKLLRTLHVIVGYIWYLPVAYRSVSLFHLFNHAFLKTPSIFLAAGVVIHNFAEQDMQRMGGLIKI